MVGQTMMFLFTVLKRQGWFSGFDNRVSLGVS